ncbi:YolD-like family protein [Bacillus songklensis]|uniref:YolD-like family protein n=1 Tax=Bacillus songklensis TaxID=1069116 RepID=A0ABV8B8E5_9BACI
MILKELIENRFVTISYYKNGSLQKCTGYIFRLNLDEQTIFLKNQHQKIVSIRLSRIMEIY